MAYGYILAGIIKTINYISTEDTKIIYPEILDTKGFCQGNRIFDTLGDFAG
jgi:hypothetical protein